MIRWASKQRIERLGVALLVVGCTGLRGPGCPATAEQAWGFEQAWLEGPLSLAAAQARYESELGASLEEMRGSVVWLPQMQAWEKLAEEAQHSGRIWYLKPPALTYGSEGLVILRDCEVVVYAVTMND